MDERNKCENCQAQEGAGFLPLDEDCPECAALNPEPEQTDEE